MMKCYNQVQDPFSFFIKIVSLFCISDCISELDYMLRPRYYVTTYK